jgi:hypothetical protein
MRHSTSEQITIALAGRVGRVAVATGADLETGRVSEGLRVRDLMMMTADWVRTSAGASGSVMTWRRTADYTAVGAGHGCGRDREGGVHSEDRVRCVIHNFNADGFASLYTETQGRAVAEIHLGPAT